MEEEALADNNTPAERQNEAVVASNPKEITVSWETQEFHHGVKGVAWYVVWSTVILGTIGYSIYSRQWTSIAVALALAFALYRFANLSPGMTRCEINDNGVYFNDRFYSFTEIHSFSISYNTPVKVLELLTTKRYMYAIRIPLVDDMDPVALRGFLITKIPEEPFREDLIEKISRILKI